MSIAVRQNLYNSRLLILGGFVISKSLFYSHKGYRSHNDVFVPQKLNFSIH